MIALGMASLGTQCDDKALGMASVGLFCDLSGGGSGVHRLARAGYFSRAVGRRYPSIFQSQEPEIRAEIERIEAETPEAVVNAITAARQGVKGKIGPKRREKIEAAAQKELIGNAQTFEADPLDGFDIDAIIRHVDLLWEIRRWRQDEEEIAILMLSLG